MDAEKEIEQVKKDLAEAQSKITELQIAAARREGTQAGAVWWLGGIAALIAAWLGITSLWQIPRLVRATASGQAEQEAKAAADSAKKYSAALKVAAEAIPKYVRYDEFFRLQPESNGDRYLTISDRNHPGLQMSQNNIPDPPAQFWKAIERGN
jgi:hypothetical protein